MLHFPGFSTYAGASSSLEVFGNPSCLRFFFEIQVLPPVPH